MEMRIDSEESSAYASDYCHDGIFTIDEVAYDKDKMAFSIILTREMWEKAKQEKRFLFLQRWKIPKIRSILTFLEVIEANIASNDILDVLENIDYDKSVVSFNCMGSTKMTIVVNKLNGKLKDIGKEFFDGTTFTSLRLKRKFQERPR